MSEKIERHHLERKAIVYVRQSSVYQVLHNRAGEYLLTQRKQHFRLISVLRAKRASWKRTEETPDH